MKRLTPLTEAEKQRYWALVLAIASQAPSPTVTAQPGEATPAPAILTPATSAQPEWEDGQATGRTKKEGGS